MTGFEGLIGPALGIGTQLLGGVFGSTKSGRESPNPMFLTPNIKSLSASAPGFNLTATNNNGDISGGLDASTSFGSTVLKDRLNRSLADIDALRAGLNPGYGRVTEARRNAIANARQRAIGDLKATLGRRRIEGSSFANSSLSQAEAEFGKATAEADAQSYLEELDAGSKLIAQENDMLYREASRELTQLGISADFQARLAGLVTQDAATRLALMQSDLNSQRNINAQSDAAAGKWWGSLGTQISGAFGGLGKPVMTTPPATLGSIIPGMS